MSAPANWPATSNAPGDSGDVSVDLSSSDPNNSDPNDRDPNDWQMGHRVMDDNGFGGNDTTTVTWRQLFAETRDRLSDGQHAKWMCQQVTDSTNGEWLKLLDTRATHRAVVRLDSMVARRLTGEPLQYVLGSWSFRRLDLLVDRRVLIPRPETEQVVEVALDLARQCPAPRLIADLGTGSGAIALSLAVELPRASTQIWATDASADALDVCRANLAGIGVAGGAVRLALGDWFDALPRDLLGRFDVIVSNPPYIAIGAADVESAVTDWEPAPALFAGSDGLDDLRSIISGAPRWLRPGGFVVLEIGADQGEAVAELLQRVGLVAIQIRSDLAGLDRIALGHQPS
jgi:release factor glutamine methyltransferase